MPKVIKVTRESIQRAYKAEIDAAWLQMSKRFDRAMLKRERELSKLAKAEMAEFKKSHGY